MDKRRPLYIAFVDLEKAFDNVNWNELMEIMTSANLDYRDRCIIYELYKNQRSIVNMNGEMQEACVH